MGVFGRYSRPIESPKEPFSSSFSAGISLFRSEPSLPEGTDPRHRQPHAVFMSCEITEVYPRFPAKRQYFIAQRAGATVPGYRGRDSLSEQSFSIVSPSSFSSSCICESINPGETYDLTHRSLLSLPSHQQRAAIFRCEIPIFSFSSLLSSGGERLLPKHQIID